DMLLGLGSVALSDACGKIEVLCADASIEVPPCQGEPPLTGGDHARGRKRRERDAVGSGGSGAQGDQARSQGAPAAGIRRPEEDDASRPRGRGEVTDAA